MRNLVLFLIRFYDFFLFLLLEIIAFILLYQSNTYHRAGFLNYAYNVSGTFYTAVTDVKTYFSLKSVNDSLLAENARLKSKLLESFYTSGFDTIMKEDSLLKQKFVYVPAMVISNSVIKRNNFLIIDKGAIHGIKEHMGVICENGVVGIVKEVSENFSTVLSLLNINSRISAMVVGNGAFGSLIWKGFDPQYANLVKLNVQARVKLGQKVATSGYSSIFPPGVPIGTITNIDYEPGANFYNLTIGLSTNFINLDHVYIIQNILKPEIDTLTINMDNLTIGDNE